MSDVTRPPMESDSGGNISNFPALDFAAERQDMIAAFDVYVNQNQQPDGRIARLTILQSGLLLKVRDFIAGHNTHGLLHLACGSGKSALATTMADAMGMGYLRANGSRRQALLNTSRNSIVGQFVNRNIQYSNDDEGELLGDFEYFAPRIQPSIYNKLGKNALGDVVVMPYQSLGTFIRQGAIQPEQFSLYLLDESHNIGSKRAQILRDFAGNDPLFIGLSATPDKSREFLPTVIDRITMADGITKYGFLSDIKLYGLNTGYDFYPTAYARGDYIAQDTGHLAHNEARNRLIMSTIFSNVLKYGPGLVKCHPKLPDGFSHLTALSEMANYCAPLITRGGKTRPIRVEAVSSTIKGSDAVIEEFIHGDSIDALTFVDLIGEGFNMPHSYWGLWTPPTISYRALEQFIGRGIRRDPRNQEKVFQFFQLVDTDTRRANNALGWELFDAPRDAREVHITNKQGISYKKAGSANKTDKGTPMTPVISSNNNQDRLITLSLDSSMFELDPDKIVTTLDDIQAAIGIERVWLRRILFEAGFTAYMRLVDGEPAITYTESALDFAKQEIATANDLTISEVAEKVGMREASVRLWIERHDINVTLLYPRKWVKTRQQAHLRPEDFLALQERFKLEATMLRPDEVVMRDIFADLGITGRKACAKYYEIRGFNLDSRKTEVSGSNPKLIGKKAEVLPWATDYKNAGTAPQDFVLLGGLTKQRYDAGPAQYSDVLIALYNLGIKPSIYIKGKRERAEYIPQYVRKDVEAETSRVIAQRLAAEADPSLKAPTIGGFIFGLESSAALATTEATSAIKAAEAVAPTDQASRAPADNEAIADTKDAEALEESLQNKEVSLDYYPLSLLQVIMARHPAFRGVNPQNPIHPQRVKNMVTNILGRAPVQLPQIPRNWVFAGDLAAELGVAELELVCGLVQQKINNHHARYVELNGVRGILAFYSPDLANALRRKYNLG